MYISVVSLVAARGQVRTRPSSNEKVRTPEPQILEPQQRRQRRPFTFLLLAVSNTVRDEGSISHQSAVARYKQPSQCCSHSFADPVSMRSLDCRGVAHALHQRTEDRHMDQQPAEAMAVCGSTSVSAIDVAIIAMFALWRGGSWAN